MKLSIETKVAAAVAAGVMAITAGAMGQTQSSGQAPNQYAPSTSPSVNTHLGNRGYNNTSSTGQNQQSFADEAAPTPSNGQNRTTRHKTKKASKHRTQQNQQNQQGQGTQTNGPSH